MPAISAAAKHLSAARHLLLIATPVRRCRDKSIRCNCVIITGNKTAAAAAAAASLAEQRRRLPTTNKQHHI